MKITILCLLLVWATMFFPSWSQYYQSNLYPWISKTLTNISSSVPFSLYDTLIVLLVVILLVLIFQLIFQTGRLHSLKRIFIFLSWIYIWFYASWGINYFAPGFAQQNRLTYQNVEASDLKEFLSEYITKTNQAHQQAQDEILQPIDNLQLRQAVEKAYHKTALNYFLPPVSTDWHVKSSLFSDLYAKMGVRGYFGPFFGESHFNGLALNYEVASIKAHELTHKLGITSEAEANLLGYLLTINTDNPTYQFSGYFSLLPYLLSDARRILPESDYKKLVDQLHPDIKQLFNDRSTYWQSLYSPQLGDIQEWIYNIYLKQNKIDSGTKNYSQVVNLLLSIQTIQNKQ